MNLGTGRDSRGRGTPCTWRDVLAAIQTSETRSRVVALYREAGFTADGFGARDARKKMMELLIRAEDRTEDEHPGRHAERAAMKAVRRRLEVEAYP